MEENTMMMQALVIAHACYGHNSFFKGNYLFRTWTDAGSIIDYLAFAKRYIAECEERHGVEAVEKILDSCHALMNHGVDRYKRPYPVSAEEERRRQRERAEYEQHAGGQRGDGPRAEVHGRAEDRGAEGLDGAAHRIELKQPVPLRRDDIHRED
ncbi:MAG: SpoVR family protein, partial [Gammaproteobacteria bacterium]|nr:SpoVR family protein [Gammaproteobacteria bacterium]